MVELFKHVSDDDRETLSFCKKMSRSLTMANFTFLAVSLVAILFCHVLAADTQQKEISLVNMRDASEQLEELFTNTGIKNVEKLTKSGDRTVAIHAAWELAKGNAPQTDRFLGALKTQIGVEPPKWWKDQVRGIKIYEKNCHYVPGVTQLDEDADYRLLHEGYQIVAKPRVAGFPYPITITDATTKGSQSITVWAAGRSMLAGLGVHQFEMMVADGKLCVFGTESHGAYAEQFGLADGKPLLRFSTCYWFNFSENWTWADAKAKRAEHVSADQPAIQPADKPPAKGQSSTQPSKDDPR